MRKTASNVLQKNFKSSFISCQKDQEAIWRKLFVESRPYSDKLKRLLIVNSPDCLDMTQKQYQDVIDSYTIKRMKDEHYISIIPKLPFGEHEEVKAYLLMEFDDFVPTANREFRDCIISFSIICNLDYWNIDDYQLRPHLIAGYVDGILNGARLSGIGKLEFIGASQLVLSEYLGGLLLRYVATHGKDDEENIISDLPAPQDIDL